MAYCVKCGEKVEDTAVICPFCGAVIPGKEASAKSGEYSGYAYGNAQSGEGGEYSGYAYGNAQSGEGGQNTYQTNCDGRMADGCFPNDEVKRNKGMAVLCYIGILVFIPVLAGDGQSEYLKLHKNQGMVMFIVTTFLNVLERNWGWSTGIFERLTGGLLGVGCDIVKLVVLVLWIMGIVYACRGTRQELPVIGKIKMFK